MGLRQALGLLFTEIWFTIKKEHNKLINTSFVEFLNVIDRWILSQGDCIELLENKKYWYIKKEKLMNKCRDCRFYNGKICNINGYKRTPTFGCIHFSLYR